jgi:predicted flap endonuclease-1-like 5' DNA nuclease
MNWIAGSLNFDQVWGWFVIALAFAIGFTVAAIGVGVDIIAPRRRYNEAEVVPDEAVSNSIAVTPVAESPVAEEPVAEVPVAEAPVAEVPVAEEPVAEVPVAEAPVAEVPVAEVPVAEAPVAEAPVAEAPVIEAPVAEAPVIEAPQPTTPASTPDDLTKIEGVGPKMSAALKAVGVDTFAKLAAQDTETLKTALAGQGVRFTPTIESWVEQATYAAKGDWDTLSKLQGWLESGRYPTDKPRPF